MTINDFRFVVARATSLGIYVMSMVGMLVFTFTLDLGQIWIVFVTAGSLG